MYHEFYPFPRHGNEENSMTIRPPARNFMLNSIVMMSQVARGDDGRLDWLASNMLPTLVRWASQGPTAGVIHHPLLLRPHCRSLTPSWLAAGRFAGCQAIPMC